MGRRGWILAGVGALGALAGALLVSGLRGPAEPAPPRAEEAGDATAAVAALREDLAAERAARESLEAEVALLRAALSEWTGAAGEAGAPAPGQGPAEPPASAGTPEGGAESPAGTAGPWFDEAGLRDAGLPDPEVDRLHGIFEQLQMDELYLRDQAAREGWLRRPRYRREMAGLRGELRREVGDESWDWMLYATGRPNRVRVADVLDSSPAARAGLEPGDLVLRYDDQRVFNGPELQRATSQGRPGSSVPVDVLRSGDVVRVYVPRGPLGVRLGPARHVPETG